MPDAKYYAKAFVILFGENSFGDQFFKLSELKSIKDLFERASRGVCLTCKTSIRISQKIAAAYLKNGVERFISFMQILHELASSTEYRLLVNPALSFHLIEGRQSSRPYGDKDD